VEVLTEGTAGYEAVRVPQIPRFAHVRPAAIARCGDGADVAEALALARERGLPIAVRSGGHCFAGRSSTDGLLIDVSPIDHVSLDAGVVTVGAGARLADIYDALEPERTIAGGCGPTVGIAGLALGGGLGILGRRYGLTCDQVVAAEVVLASGEIVRADDNLLWALKGAGGGHFGVVTSLALKTVPAPPTTCFHEIYPAARAAELIDEWQQWSPEAAPETAASLVVRPDGVHLFGVGEIDAAGAVALPYREAKRWLVANGPPEIAEDYPSTSLFFRDALPGDVVPAGGELDFSPWGGAYNDVAPDATAFPHRDARFLLKLSGPPEWLERAYAAARPYSTGGAYVNFPDPDLRDWETAYYGANYARLQEVKGRVDPDEVFSFHQSVAAPRSEAAATARG
jgi:FAD/FMN-containing dehydrogenase